jgi:hypothetical protein
MAERTACSAAAAAAAAAKAAAAAAAAAEAVIRIAAALLHYLCCTRHSIKLQHNANFTPTHQQSFNLHMAQLAANHNYSGIACI